MGCCSTSRVIEPEFDASKKPVQNKPDQIKKEIVPSAKTASSIKTRKLGNETKIVQNVFEPSKRNSIDSTTIKKMSTLFQKQPEKTIVTEKVGLKKSVKSENFVESRDFIEFTIYPSKKKFETKIYVLKGEKISFSISGLWKMLPYLDYVDAEGHKNFPHIDDFGSLIGSVGGDAFQIANNSIYESVRSGILYLYPHVENSDIEPSGSLKVKVSGGHHISETNNLSNFFTKEFEEINAVIHTIDRNLSKQEITVVREQNLMFYFRGKWRLFSDHEFSEGPNSDPTTFADGFPLGCVIFELNGLKTEINDETNLTCHSDGIGQIYVNVGDWIVEPEGEIKIFVKTI